MTKSDIALLAKGLRDSRPIAHPHHIVWLQCVDQIAYAIADTHPRFKVADFRAACRSGVADSQG
jgi:hypothetical protein